MPSGNAHPLQKAQRMGHAGFVVASPGFMLALKGGPPSITVSALSRATNPVAEGRLIPAAIRGFDFPFVELLVLRLLLLIRTQGSLLESRGGNFGSTNHLSGHRFPTMIRCSDSPTNSGRQGAQSAQRCVTPSPGWPTGCLACEPAAHNWPGPQHPVHPYRQLAGDGDL